MDFLRSILPLCLLSAGCVGSVRPLSEDHADLSPREALDATLDGLEEAYAFTAWKGLDWDATRERLREDMAEAGRDPIAQDHVWRELVLSIPDGHVLLWNDEEPARNLCPEAEGSLGLGFAETLGSGIVVTWVEPGSAAEEAGIEPGDQLVAWGNEELEDALELQPLHCYPVGLATNERRREGRIRLLGRGPVGEEQSLWIQGRGAAPEEHLLEAVDRGEGVRAALGLALPEERVSARMLNEDIGYLRIGWEDTLLTEREVKEELRALWVEGARALVLDLRDNDGGTDQAAANLVGLFTDRTLFYETVTMYDRRTGDQAVISEVWIEPQDLEWELPVVVLVNGNTVSSGEGMAMMLGRLEGVEIVGFEGTAASFGSSGSTTKLPGDWTLTWPAGRSLDADGVIQLDSDATLEGGVQPTVRIPATVRNRIGRAEDPEGFAIDWAVDVLEAR